MHKLTDYVGIEQIRRLENAFYSVAGVPIRICGEDGRPFTDGPANGLETPHAPSSTGQTGPPACAEWAAAGCQAPVMMEGEAIGRVVYPPADQRQASGSKVGPSPQADSIAEFAKVMAEGLSRQCRRSDEERPAARGRGGDPDEAAARVAELATLYRLTAEFTGQRNLQAVLDLVARTVVEVVKAKACSIRLLNEERTELVIRAVANLSPEYLNKGPILVSESKIDQEVLSGGKPIYIADERTDPRVLYPAEARHEGIVSALCAPMTYKGRAEGVIHVYTAEPHEFDWFEVSLLQAIAAQAAAAIVNARLYEEAVRSAEIKRALQVAAEVQRRMIPAKPPSVPGLEIGAVYVPCFELGGDFYDFIMLPEDNLGLCICDVMGKGVRASLLMASVRASLRAHAVNIYAISDVLAKVNRDLCNDTLTSEFATLFYGVIDLKARRLTYANAGHVPPLLFRDGKAEELSPSGPIVGINPKAGWTHKVLVLRSGDLILAYTDGLSDAMNFADESFGHQRIRQAALEAVAQGLSAEGIVRHVLWTMRRFSGLQSRLDDLTMIAIKVT